jgi:uncharacterized hydrophobic protein (TIGR00271 family)
MTSNYRRCRLNVWPPNETIDGRANIMNVFVNIMRDNRFRPEDLPKFESKLFFEGARRRPYLVKFFVLLFLSTIIAGYGVINDSDATVIGAMIVAPLMTPIMASAAALVMGDLARSWQSLLLVAAGMALVIVLSWLIGAGYTGVISFTQNSQIVGRISPRGTDLIIALASGAAGAFAFSRDDIADSLPGVAIAISLVPPLCVVGISLSQGQWDAASGAMLLYMTNFLAIMLAGGGVLGFLGLGAAATRTLRGNARRNAFALIALGVVIVSVPLAATSVRVATDSWTQLRTAQVAQAWLEGTEYELRNVRVGGSEVTVLIAGEGEAPPIDRLKSSLEEGTSQSGTVVLEIVPIEIEQIGVNLVD